jgi:DNA-binding response OmpR family regulator
LQAADEFRPEIVLLDIGMLRLDRYETCKRMRAQDWGRKDDRDRNSGAGVDLHPAKPLDPVAINALLVDLVSIKMSQEPRAAASGDRTQCQHDTLQRLFRRVGVGPLKMQK